MTIENKFLDAISELKNHLYKEDLYTEGLVTITYDRIDKNFHINDQPDQQSIAMDEYANRNNNYLPEQKRIITIDISALREGYNDSLRENNINEDQDAKDNYYFWEAICDNIVEIALEQQLDADIEDIISEFEKVREE